MRERCDTAVGSAVRAQPGAPATVFGRAREGGVDDAGDRSSRMSVRADPDATRMTVSRFSLSSEVVLILPFTMGSYAKRSIVLYLPFLPELSPDASGLTTRAQKPDQVGALGGTLPSTLGPRPRARAAGSGWS